MFLCVQNSQKPQDVKRFFRRFMRTKNAVFFICLFAFCVFHAFLSLRRFYARLRLFLFLFAYVFCALCACDKTVFFICLCAFYVFYAR